LAYSLLRYRLGPVLMAAGFWGGCYTGPINMGPAVHINPPPGRFFRGQAVTYTANASDPDNDALKLLLAWTPGTCPSDYFSPEKWPAAEVWSPGPDLVVGSTKTRAPFCVWAMAVDSYGATAVDAKPAEPDDHPPMAALAVIDPQTNAPFPLHTIFRLSSDGSKDDDTGDPVIPTWTLLVSPSPMASLEHCPGDSSETLRCLTADVPGDYQVRLDISDGVVSSFIQKTLTVLPGHAPIAVLDLLAPAGNGPYPLGSAFRVSGSRSTVDPGDKKMPNWTLNTTGAPTSIATLRPCVDDPSEFVRCFAADAPGHYIVELSVSDGSQDSAPVGKTFEVLDDTPPCLLLTAPTMTSPVVGRDAKMDVTFEVISVKDDLDPVVQADWFLKEGSTAFRLYENDFPKAKIPAGQYLFGDQIQVRVQIRDRNVSRSELAFTACGDAPTCFTGAPSDGCFQRFTWTVNFIQ
jgi:hypothetical protein